MSERFTVWWDNLMAWWMPSRWRTAFWTLVALDFLYHYVARIPGLFGTVWESLALAAVAMFCAWESVALRLYRGRGAR